MSLTKAQMTDVLELLEIISASFPSQAGDGMAATRGYLMAIEGHSYEGIVTVLRNVILGKQTGFEGRFAPTPAQLSRWCEKADVVADFVANRGKGEKLVTYALGAEPPEGHVPLGPTVINFGYGDVDLSGLSHAEKERVLSDNKHPLRFPENKGRTLSRLGFTVGDPENERHIG